MCRENSTYESEYVPSESECTCVGPTRVPANSKIKTRSGAHRSTGRGTKRARRSTSRGSRFLDLPAEIRNAIYGFVFLRRCRHSRVRSLQLAGPSNSVDVTKWYVSEASRALDVAILRTNRQVYNEAAPIFYRKHSFYFAEDDGPRRNILTCTITFTRRFHGLFAANLRDLTINALGPSTRRKVVMNTLSVLADCTSLKILRLRGSWDLRVAEFDLLCNITNLEQVDFFCIGDCWSPVFHIWKNVPNGTDKNESIEKLLTRIMTRGSKSLCPKWSGVLKTWRDRLIREKQNK